MAGRGTDGNDESEYGTGQEGGFDQKMSRGPDRVSQTAEAVITTLF